MAKTMKPAAPTPPATYEYGRSELRPPSTCSCPAAPPAGCSGLSGGGMSSADGVVAGGGVAGAGGGASRSTAVFSPTAAATVLRATSLPVGSVATTSTAPAGTTMGEVHAAGGITRPATLRVALGGALS